MSQPPPYYPPAEPGWTPAPPRPPRWGRFVAWTGVAAVAAFVLGGGVAVLVKDDEGSFASPAACKQALADNYRKAMTAGPGAPTMPSPPSCVGLGEGELRRIVGEVVSEYLGSDQADEDFERLIREGMESAAAQP